MKRLTAILVLVMFASVAQATPAEDKKKERDSKKGYMAAKAAWIANPNPGMYVLMMKARRDMATEVIKYRKNRKK